MKKPLLVVLGALAVMAAIVVPSGADDPPGPTHAEFCALKDRVAALDGGDTCTAPATFSGTVTDDDGFTVPAGETWTFDPDVSTTVTVRANVVVEGRLEMKPANAGVVHTLRFLGINETSVVGGHTMTVIPTDVGLWVMGAGQLDLEGTPRAGWNRTGTDPTWQPGDDIRSAPQAAGNYATFAPFTPGQPVPVVTDPWGAMHATEIVNLTRNVRIEGGGTNPGGVLASDGRAHIFIQSSQPQTIRYAELRYLGPRKPDPSNGAVGVVGRYPLHFHMAGDGSRDSLVEGTVIRDAGNHGFVPHLSHGVTFRDTVVFDSWGHGYWWDDNTSTDDVLIDHAAAFMLRPWPAHRGYGLSGFMLGAGHRMTIRGSVVAGNLGNYTAAGFTWSEGAGGDANSWDFADDNVAHNNVGSGARVWQNNGFVHDVPGFVSYRNGYTGVDHGAYGNIYAYSGLTLWGNAHAGFQQHAVRSSPGRDFLVGSKLDKLVIVRHQNSTPTPTVYRNNRIGQVVIDEITGGGTHGTVIEFRSDSPVTDLTPGQFTVIGKLSTITVYNSDGSSFTV